MADRMACASCVRVNGFARTARLGTRPRSCQHDLDAGLLGENPARDIIARHPARHDDVAENDIGRLAALQKLDRLRPGPRLADRITKGFQSSERDFPDAVVVLDDEDGLAVAQRRLAV
jgi:hypothetical protein